ILKKRLRHILDPEMKRNKPNKIRRLITMMSLLTLAGAACTIGLRESTAQDELAEPSKAAEEEQLDKADQAMPQDRKPAAEQKHEVLDAIIIDRINMQDADANAAIDFPRKESEDAVLNFVLLKEA